MTAHIFCQCCWCRRLAMELTVYSISHLISLPVLHDDVKRPLFVHRDEDEPPGVCLARYQRNSNRRPVRMQRRRWGTTFCTIGVRHWVRRELVAELIVLFMGLRRLGVDRHRLCLITPAVAQEIVFIYDDHRRHSCGTPQKIGVNGETQTGVSTIKSLRLAAHPRKNPRHVYDYT